MLFLYIGAAIAGYTVYYTTWITLGEKLANIYPQSRVVHIFRTANIALLLRLLLITPLFIFIGVRISHRIAGPIYRIDKHLDSMLQGDYSHTLTLRKNDELKSIASRLSTLCKKLQEDKERNTKAINSTVKYLQDQKIDSKALTKVKTQLKDLNL